MKNLSKIKDIPPYMLRIQAVSSEQNDSGGKNLTIQIGVSFPLIIGTSE